MDIVLETDCDDFDGIEDTADMSILDGADPVGICSELADEFAIRISCFVHTLQLGVNKFMWKDKLISEIIAKAMKLSAKLRTPIVRLKMDMENVSNAIMNQVTRWNSTFLMLKRLVTKLMEFCIKFQNEKGFEELKVADSTWNQFKQLIEVLGPVADLTTQLQAEDLTVPDFLYKWMAMKMELEEIATSNGDSSNYARKLIICIEEREKKIFSNKIVVAGWYLDKNLNVLMDPDQISAAKIIIRMVAYKQDIISPNDNHVEEEEEELEEPDESDDASTGSFDKFLQAKGKAATKTNPAARKTKKEKSSDFDKEINAFDKLAVPRKRSSAIDWWNQNSEQFPLLSKVALDVISVPVTEVTVERLFSHLKTILNRHRSRMNGTLLNDIMLLRLNKKFDGTNQ